MKTEEIFNGVVAAVIFFLASADVVAYISGFAEGFGINGFLMLPVKIAVVVVMYRIALWFCRKQHKGKTHS